jgi:hypothetical protein
MLHGDVRGVRQDPVLSKETDQIREPDSRAAEEGTDGALQAAQQALLANGFVNDVRVPWSETKKVSNGRQESLPETGQARIKILRILAWGRGEIHRKWEGRTELP